MYALPRRAWEDSIRNLGALSFLRLELSTLSVEFEADMLPSLLSSAVRLPDSLLSDLLPQFSVGDVGKMPFTVIRYLFGAFCAFVVSARGGVGDDVLSVFGVSCAMAVPKKVVTAKVSESCFIIINLSRYKTVLAHGVSRVMVDDN